KNIPQLPLHVSTQANVLNSEAALFYHEAFNVERIILARELTLEQIKEMRKTLPEKLQLEAFVHGAMCMAYSGRCLLSNALTGRGGNQGECAQSCRWKYSLVEAKRPGEEIPIYEDENGTYLLSSYDMCMLPYLPDLVNSGLSSLKIEGRMKNEYYVATVVAAYRKALDALYESEEKFNNLLPLLMLELDKVGHRATNTGFYYGNPEPPAGAKGVMQSMEYVGKINTAALANEEAAVTLKNRFFVGDKLEVVSPDGIYDYSPEYIKLEKDGSLVDTYSVANETVYLKFPFKVNKGDIIRGPNRNHRFSV
ncbi:MAG: U32 family peptidase, partial [Christensenellaceae bacterium]|nr:U32 family peptidase [Christensenellaceae bacterium]